MSRSKVPHNYLPEIDKSKQFSKHSKTCKQCTERYDEIKTTIKMKQSTHRFRLHVEAFLATALLYHFRLYW